MSDGDSPAHCGHHAALQLGTVFTHSMRSRWAVTARPISSRRLLMAEGARSEFQASGARPERGVTQHMAESKSHGRMRPHRNGVAIRFSTGPDARPSTESQIHRRPSHSLPAPRGHRPAWAKKTGPASPSYRPTALWEGESTGILYIRIWGSRFLSHRRCIPPGQ